MPGFSDMIALSIASALYVVISVVFTAKVALAEARCYRPDGSLMNTDYQPCHPGPRHSMCCASNRTISNVNQCSRNDLCLEIFNSVEWRESCTDPTWKDPACLRLCINGFVQTKEGLKNMTRSDVMTTICPDGSYCCGHNNSICCENKTGYWVRNMRVFNYSGFPESELSEPSTYVMDISAGISTSAGSSTSIANFPSGANSGLSQEVKIALALGLGVGLIIVLLLIANLSFWVRWYKRQKSEAAMTSNPNPEAQQKPHLMGSDLYQKPMELDQPRAELADTRLKELDSLPPEISPMESEEEKSLKIQVVHP